MSAATAELDAMARGQARLLLQPCRHSPTTGFWCEAHGSRWIATRDLCEARRALDVDQVPAGARYEVREGRGQGGYVLVDSTWRDMMVGPYRTGAEAHRRRRLMQAVADLKQESL